MHNLENLRPYPKYFKYLPISKHGFTTFLRKTIYLNKDILEDLQSANPDPLSIAVLKHQKIHIQDAGIKKFLRYILSKDFRLKEEEKAFKVMFKHLKENNKSFDLEALAINFSGIRYLWLLRRSKALRIITRFWKEA